mmetsp:Transcript_96030/g.185209  ORF Transcript_96030/g.185209 Transcript_96030/m.185209 type:complete len:167 (-) Transcript_96030:43-543(-)
MDLDATRVVARGKPVVKVFCSPDCDTNGTDIDATRIAQRNRPCRSPGRKPDKEVTADLEMDKTTIVNRPPKMLRPPSPSQSEGYASSRSSRKISPRRPAEEAAVDEFARCMEEMRVAADPYGKEAQPIERPDWECCIVEWGAGPTPRPKMMSRPKALASATGQKVM